MGKDSSWTKWGILGYATAKNKEKNIDNINIGTIALKKQFFSARQVEGSIKNP